MRATFGLVALLACACAARRTEGEDPLSLALASADRAWERRGQDGLEPVGEALASAWALAPDEPGVRWRFARLDVAVGLVSDDEIATRRAFGRAKAHGLACLDGAAGVVEARSRLLWADAITRAGPGRAPCAAWTALAWARWRVAVGPAGAVDDDDLAALTAALIAPGAASTADPSGVAVWAWAIVGAVTGQADADRRFSRAVAADPGDLVRRADRLALVATEDEEGRAWLARQEASTPEERAVLARTHSLTRQNERASLREAD